MRGVVGECRGWVWGLGVWENKWPAPVWGEPFAVIC